MSLYYDIVENGQFSMPTHSKKSMRRPIFVMTKIQFNTFVDFRLKIDFSIERII
jgi:hypothetical protein